MNQRSGSCSPMPYHLAMAPNMSNLSLLYSNIQITATGESIGRFGSAETLACPLGQATPRVGFEPTTLRLTAGCSTAELSRNELFPQNRTLNPNTYWLSYRPISDHQLNISLCLHLGPIYLVVFKGSFGIATMDISS